MLHKHSHQFAQGDRVRRQRIEPRFHLVGNGLRPPGRDAQTPADPHPSFLLLLKECNSSIAIDLVLRAGSDGRSERSAHRSRCPPRPILDQLVIQILLDELLLALEEGIDVQRASFHQLASAFQMELCGPRPAPPSVQREGSSRYHGSQHAYRYRQRTHEFCTHFCRGAGVAGGSW